MGKPRLIILIRHAQSEGNLSRDIHQMIPDHRVKLTPEGHKQAQEAGRRLRSMLRPDDTIQFVTSPYRRTRETTEGILESLTASSEESGPSPFPRSSVKVFEEPRLREQDFGNFQPCSAEMERMWQERADYGHFFYRIPNGESAADAYDRVSGFNESLWRSFNEDDFPSVCVLVTHGLMTRVFLMKWYHWSVEYFEDLRNINHCEFVIMNRNPDEKKYTLENKLRTWSELKRRAMSTTNLQSQASPTQSTPAIPVTRQWGGCVGGCDHKHSTYQKKQRRSTLNQDTAVPPSAAVVPRVATVNESDVETQPATGQEAPAAAADTTFSQAPPNNDSTSPETVSNTKGPTLRLPARPSPLSFNSGRDFGGSLSGAPTPMEDSFSSDEHSDADGDAQSPTHTSTRKRDYFADQVASKTATKPAQTQANRPKRQTTSEDMEAWAKQSGMGSGARADALGDEPEEEEDDGDAEDDYHEE